MKKQWKRALDLRSNGHLKESNQLFTTLVKQFPDDASLNYHCAWSYDLLGEEAKAVSYYEKAIQLGLAEEDLVGAIIGLGSTYRTLGQYDKSHEVLRKGRQLFPMNRAIQVFHSMTLYNLKEHHVAMELLLQCLLQSTTDKEIMKYKKAIAFYSDKLDTIWK